MVADNDKAGSAEPVVLSFGRSSVIPIKYCLEPRQNIALTRNKAIENADGDFIAFIDDDELPTTRWLVTLFKACDRYGVDGVLGPVRRRFDEQPPGWLLRSDLYERVIRPSGAKVGWHESRTGNVLLKKHLFEGDEQPFRPEFRAGEDQDFFRRKIDRGNSFAWSAEAVVYEVVPPARWKRRYMLKKALLRGATARLQPGSAVLSIAKSALAVLVYVVMLPLLLLFAHHRFMTVLVKLFDHVGKLLAFCGINPIKDPYVTE